MSSPQPVKDLIVDAFERTTAAGAWGAATTGGTWGISGTGTPAGAAALVTGGRGTFALTSTNTSAQATLTVASRDVDVTGSVGLSAVPAAGSIATFAMQLRSTNPSAGGGGQWYGFAILTTASPAGNLACQCSVSSSTILASKPFEVPQNPANRWSFRARLTGANPTTLQMRVWREGTAEPDGWNIQATDSTPALQARNTYTALVGALSGAGATPVTITVDNVKVSAVEPGTQVVRTAAVELDFGGGTVVELECDANALELAPSTEDIDVGVFCEPSATEQGRTTYTAVLSGFWSPDLYTKLVGHVGQDATLRFYPDAADTTRYITFGTRYSSVPWGRFEVGQAVPVDLALAVLTTPDYVGELA